MVRSKHTRFGHVFDYLEDQAEKSDARIMEPFMKLLQTSYPNVSNPQFSSQ